MKKEFRFGVLVSLIVLIAISTFPNLLCQASFWDQAQDWGNSVSSQIDQWAQSTQDTFSDWSSEAGDGRNWCL